jgi:hypothetical protein
LTSDIACSISRFTGFFRRVESGQKSGFPRFKSSKRYSGFCYPDPAGWGARTERHARCDVRLGSGKNAISVRARGRHRFGEAAEPNDLTTTRRNDQWFASVTLRATEEACARVRIGDAHRGVDFGVTEWATSDNGDTIANPRFVQNSRPRLAQLPLERARKKKGSVRHRLVGGQIATLHDRIANLRRDFLHKETTRIVKACAVRATEELRTQDMTRSARGTMDKPGRMVRQKAGLNREILSAGLSMTHQVRTGCPGSAGDTAPPVSSVLKTTFNVSNNTPSAHHSFGGSFTPATARYSAHESVLFRETICVKHRLFPAPQDVERRYLSLSIVSRDTPKRASHALDKPA